MGNLKCYLVGHASRWFPEANAIPVMLQFPTDTPKANEQSYSKIMMHKEKRPHERKGRTERHKLILKYFRCRHCHTDGNEITFWLQTKTGLKIRGQQSRFEKSHFQWGKRQSWTKNLDEIGWRSWRAASEMEDLNKFSRWIPHKKEKKEEWTIATMLR